MPRPGPARGEQAENGPRRVGHVQFSRVCRKILLVSQTEIDTVLARLEKLNLVSVEPVKSAFFRRNLLGEAIKESEHVVDKVLTIKDPDTYLHVVRNLAKEAAPEAPPRTEGLEFVDLYGFAEMADIASAAVHGRIADRTVPLPPAVLRPRGGAAVAGAGRGRGPGQAQARAPGPGQAGNR